MLFILCAVAVVSSSAVAIKHAGLTVAFGATGCDRRAPLWGRRFS